MPKVRKTERKIIEFQVSLVSLALLVSFILLVISLYGNTISTPAVSLAMAVSLLFIFIAYIYVDRGMKK